MYLTLLLLELLCIAMSELKRSMEVTGDLIPGFESSIVSTNQKVRCPYLDTINRQILDFDSEKLCSVTLTNMNVYACLVCGKFFQGRGKTTPAYTHSVQAGHFVFMNLHTTKSYCLPDSYEIFDASLRDVEKYLSPEYAFNSIVSLNSNCSLARDVFGISYLPGFVGFNNLNSTDYLNVLLHALGHVSPFRDFWLQKKNYDESKNSLALQFGLVIRKMWSSDSFKSVISPQELMQEISTESKKRFPVGTRVEVLDLLVWLLAQLNKEVNAISASNAATTAAAAGNGDKKRNNKAGVSPVFEPFQGCVQVTSMTKRLVDNFEEQKLLENSSNSSSSGAVDAGNGWKQTVAEVPFNFLSIDIPPNPLFRDSHGGLIIPQVPLFQLLKKFDGVTWTDQMTSDAHIRKQYRIQKLPRYLILHLSRFTKNNFNVEKNSTIVTFPVKNLEMKDFLFSTSVSSEKGREELNKAIAACPSVSEVSEWSSVSELTSLILRLGSEQQLLELKHITTSSNSGSGSNERNAAKKQRTDSDSHQQVLSDLRLLATQVVERVSLFSSTKYNLVANICHDSTAAAQNVTVGDLNLNFTDAGGVAGKARAAAAKANKVGMSTTGNSNSGSGSGASGGSSSSSSNSNSSNVLSSGSYKIHVQNKATGQWFEIQDLRVAETSPQLIGVSESNILIYEKHNGSATA